MQQAILTVDLGFGDAGKGSIVDWLTREQQAHTVVRYNGGAQAGHRVVAANGEHVFAQFGSGTLAGAATHLSRSMLLDPLAMMAEADHLHAMSGVDVWARTTIDARALVITPFGRAINRLRELARGVDRHGSCGMGIGETVADHLAYGDRVLCAGDLGDPIRLERKLAFLHSVNLAKLATFRSTLPASPQVEQELALLHDDWRDWLLPAYRDFAERAVVVPSDHLRTILARSGTVVFEGAQGVLLDEWRGFHPHTTWSTTTLANADQLLAEAQYTGSITRLGITRAYMTRHGAGPLPTEDADLIRSLPDARNGWGDWQGNFRVGWLDLPLLRYAGEVVGPLDQIAVTCLDRVATLPELRVCRSYRDGEHLIDRIVPSPTPRMLDYQAQLTRDLIRYEPHYERVADELELIDRIERTLGVPVSVCSYGADAASKQRRTVTIGSDRIKRLDLIEAVV